MTVTAHSVKITVGALFAAAVILMLVYDSSGTAQLSLCAALFHELGHIVCMTLLSKPPQEISLGVFGVKIIGSRDTEISYGAQALTALAGPAANVLLACVLGAVSVLLRDGDKMRICMYINIFIAVFNLLPVEPLDGGRALAAMLCKSTDARYAHIIMKTAAAVCISLTAAAGVLIFLRSGYNFTLLAVAAYLLICAASRENETA